MNKDIFNQLPADEQPVAAKLNSVSESMKVHQDFQWTLESQLMNAYQKKSQPNKGWLSKIIVPVGWALVAVFGFILLNWSIRSLMPPEQINPASPNTVIPVDTFESKVRQGTICKGPLAVAHGFDVSLTNKDKTAFVSLDEENAIGELRSFAWSPDGETLAVVGNSIGSSNIYLIDSTRTSLQPVNANSELGYLIDVAWSSDGKKLLTWSVENNTIVYIVNIDGTGVEEIKLGMQMFSTPRLSPDNNSIIVNAADSSSFGLFEMTLDGSQTRLISKLVEYGSGFAISPDGTRLAYMDTDRTSGRAVLMVQEIETRDVTSLPGGLSIPKGSGSSIPNIDNLSWSQDGTKLVFGFGRNVQDRAIYLANADGSGMTKVVDAAHAPAISGDGNCLAYISNKNVFLIDLTSSNPTTPLLLAELPTGRGTPDFRLNKLQWQP